MFPGYKTVYNKKFLVHVKVPVQEYDVFGKMSGFLFQLKYASNRLYRGNYIGSKTNSRKTVHSRPHNCITN